MDDTHALISPKEDKNKDKNKNNVLLANDEEMENLDLISEMGDDDRNPSPNITPNQENANRGVSPSPIAMADGNNNNNNNNNKKEIDIDIEEDEKQIQQKRIIPKIKVEENGVEDSKEDNREQPNVPKTPPQGSQLQSSEDDMSDDELDEERQDEFEYSYSASMMVSTPRSRLKKKHGYDVSTEVDDNPKFADIDRLVAGLEEADSNLSNDNDPDEPKPRRPKKPKQRPTTRARSKSLSERNVALLAGLRLGEMDVHIEICQMDELIDLLSIICRAMTMLPFGLRQFRRKMLFTLQKRMYDSYYLSQHFTFFLNSYRDCFAVSRLFRDSVCMESIIELQRLNTMVLRPSGGHVRTPSNKAYMKSGDNNNNNNVDDEKQIPNGSYLTDRNNNHNNIGVFINKSSYSETRDDIIEYYGSNVVEFFRLPLMYPQLNKSIIAVKCKELCCPLTGQSNVERLEIRHIYSSNAKPLLIDCYLRNSYSIPTSSFILKYGDDLRRDASVLMMFKFMNNLWIDNSCIYNSKQIAALTYKCFPLGPDYGIIELIPNCQTLKDITDKYVTHNKKKSNKLSDDVLNTLIATCAGSFMAAYIMGIRDRHYDNILITDSGTIFHIDFGYMLGEKVSGVDTSKFAITNDLSKLMGNKWKEFVEISVQCWVVLRENQQELLDFAKLAFAFLYPQETVQEFLKETLLLDLSINEARNKIHKRILQSPKKIKTKMKNWVHSVAAARGGTSSSSSNSSHRRENSHSKIEKKKENKNIFSSFLAPKRKLSKSSSAELISD